MKKNLSGGFLWLLCMGSALSCSLSQAREKQADETRSNNGKRVTVAFDFKRGGIASSQYAIWIENEKGELVRTLYATSFTARGGYSYREDALPLWVEKARPSNMDASQVDAVTGTTPQNGPLAYTWDGTDSRGNAVPAGNYRLFVEGTLYWKSRVLYTGTIPWGQGQTQSIPMEVNLLHPSATNQGMISALQVKYYNK